MSESLYDPAWRERDHNPISATIIGGTHQDLSPLCDSRSALSNVPLFVLDPSQELLVNQPDRRAGVVSFCSDFQPGRGGTE